MKYKYSVSSLKRKARREASYGEYNPWGGPASRRSLADSELGRRHSERAVRADIDPNSVEQIQHASSMPVSSWNAYNSSNQHIDQTDGPITQRRHVLTDPEKTINEAPELMRSSTEHQNAPAQPATPSSGATKNQHGHQHLTRKEKWRKLMKDDPVPWQQQLKSTLFPRWLTINWLLFAAPIGIGLHFANVNPLAIFIVNFVAIVPLAAILSFATEEIALRVGEVLGGLLNASFGNAVELIVGVIALNKKEILIVQTSMIGSMLSNLLLVLGMCFFAGGLPRVEQYFNTTVAQTASSLLALSVGSLIIPTAYTWGVDFDPKTSNKDEEISRGTAIIMILVYGCYLLFQLKTHSAIFQEPSQKVAKRSATKNVKGAISQMGGFAGAHAGGQIQDDHLPVVEEVEEEEEPETPQLTFVGALVVLCCSTALVGVCAEFLVSSINDVTCKYGVSQYFVGLILLPIVGNAAEHATAVTVAVRDKMDLAIGVAVGSSMQIALLILPLMVLIGWIIGADMTLIFDDFQIAVLFVAIILVNYLIADGKSHWLEGSLLMSLYVIISVAAYYYPNSNSGQCEPGSAGAAAAGNGTSTAALRFRHGTSRSNLL